MSKGGDGCRGNAARIAFHGDVVFLFSRILLTWYLMQPSQATIDLGYRARVRESPNEYQKNHRGYDSLPVALVAYR